MQTKLHETFSSSWLKRVTIHLHKHHPYQNFSELLLLLDDGPYPQMSNWLNFVRQLEVHIVTITHPTILSTPTHHSVQLLNTPLRICVSFWVCTSKIPLSWLPREQNINIILLFFFEIISWKVWYNINRQTQTEGIITHFKCFNPLYRL